MEQHRNVPHPTEVLLGFDIGSTTISAVVLAYRTGKVLETFTVANSSRLSSEYDLAEFDADWIAEQVLALAASLTKVYPHTRGIGVTGQMHGILYLSADGKAVSPLYNWQDGRGNRRFSENRSYCEEIVERTGYSCYTGYAFATLFYNNRNRIEPSAAKSFCSIMDYVVLRLTQGVKPLVHESNAASFGLYDIDKHAFDKSAVQSLGLSPDILPQLAQDRKPVGYYGTIPVYVAIGDNQASFFGSVKNEQDSALINFGTGSQVSVVTEHTQPVAQGLEVRPYLFGKRLICGSGLCGGKAYAIMEQFFAAYAQALGQEAGSQYEVMNRLAQQAYISGQPLTVSTLFCGTRQNPALRGSVTGIDERNFTPGNLLYGVLQGIVDELKAHFDRMECSDVAHFAASGNAVKKNPLLRRLLQDTFQRTVSLTSNDEEAALGSALYAGVSGSFLSFEQAKEIIQEQA